MSITLCSAKFRTFVSIIMFVAVCLAASARAARASDPNPYMGTYSGTSSGTLTANDQTSSVSATFDISVDADGNLTGTATDTTDGSGGEIFTITGSVSASGGATFGGAGGGGNGAAVSISFTGQFTSTGLSGTYTEQIVVDGAPAGSGSGTFSGIKTSQFVAVTWTAAGMLGSNT